MKIALFILFSFSWASAQQNPQIRGCRVAGGYFWSLNVEEPKPDNIGICRFNEALIDTVSILLTMDKRKAKAVTAFTSTASKVYQSCQQAGAKRILGKEARGTNIYRLCLFADDTYISETSLMEGWRSPYNVGLKNFIENWAL